MGRDGRHGDGEPSHPYLAVDRVVEKRDISLRRAVEFTDLGNVEALDERPAMHGSRTDKAPHEARVTTNLSLRNSNNSKTV